MATCTLLVDSLPSGPDQASCHVGKFYLAREGGWPLAHTQQDTKALNPKPLEKRNPLTTSRTMWQQILPQSDVQRRPQRGQGCDGDRTAGSEAEGPATCTRFLTRGNCEMINVCCFELLGLRPFVTQRWLTSIFLSLLPTLST